MSCDTFDASASNSTFSVSNAPVILFDWSPAVLAAFIVDIVVRLSNCCFIFNWSP